jgi:hypothetical protein
MANSVDEIDAGRRVSNPPPTRKRTKTSVTIVNASRVPRPRQSIRERNLAAKYSPLIYFDRNEPFLPLLVGYTIFRSDAESPSFPRRIELTGQAHPRAKLAIEYAIWWDWDIQHLYELEHTWTYVGEDSQVVLAEASWHGGFNRAVLDNGRVRLARGAGGCHPVVYSEPGKHAFAPIPQIIVNKRKAKTLESCGPNAGKGGLWVTPLFEGILDLRKNAKTDALVTAYLKKQAFKPAFAWDKKFLVTKDSLIPWATLFEWIPLRIDWWLAQLEKDAL